MGNILQQRVGNHTLEAYDLPEPFLRRAADRIIRSTYQERYHKIIRDGGATNEPENPAGNTSTKRGTKQKESSDTNVLILRHEVPDSVLGHRRSYPETRPPIRGFRASILRHDMTPWPFSLSAEASSPEIRRAADLVAERLASDGLLVTAAAAIEILDASKMSRDPAKGLRLLKTVGLPVDLLGYFQLPNTTFDHPSELVAYIARHLEEGRPPSTLRAFLSSMRFDFKPTRPGFRLVTECGEHEIGTVRLQLTRGTYWRGQGTGGNLDVARQMIELLPDASFIASIEEKHLESFLELSAGWPLRRAGRLAVLPEPLVVSQWTQDNGKAGLIDTKKGLKIATISPRYASRREDGSVFVPGESFLIESLASTGHMVIQSPLLFQGGNLMAVSEPTSGERILLVGEAEVYRNTALGLTSDQVLEAFRIEFSVDRCVVIPAVSFHIDFDLCVRAVMSREANGLTQKAKLIAFVNDSSAAARIILTAGIESLAGHGKLDSDSTKKALEHLESGQPGKFLEIIGGVLRRNATKNGHLPLSFARVFAKNDADSPVGNLQRFLLAMDTFVHDSVEPRDRHARSYLRSFGRREKDRRELNRQLTGLGWKVVVVPGFADGNRSISYLNGIHDRTRYLMPSYGGLFTPLDEAAAAVFRQELGPEVKVLPVLCGESQRRAGAIHCSAVVYPKSYK